MRVKLRWLLALPLMALPLLFFNCAKKSNAPPASSGNSYPNGGGSLGNPVPASSTTSYEVLSDGTINIYQDKELSYSPAGSGALSAFAISAMPSWATSFDTATGTIVGTPHKISDGGSFTITDLTALTTYGPFTVHVLGDTLKEQQWYLLNIGQSGFALNNGVAGEDLHDSESVKKNYLGIGVRVAISDTGTVLNHPDLTDNVLAGESRNYMNNYGSLGTWIGDPTPSATDPDNAHGTAVTGLFAAKGWNGIGGRGMAPEARFASFLFLQAQNQLSATGYLNIGLYDQFAGNFDVFNYSWGDPQCMLTEYSSTYTDKLRAGVTNLRFGKGAIYVMAAGNSFVEDTNDCYSTIAAGTDFALGNNNFSELSTTPYTINITAVNANGVAASYSTPGAAAWVASTGGEFGWSHASAGSPEISQPALVTTDYPGCNNGLSSLDKTNSVFDAGGSLNPGCNYTSTMNGTSGATPIAGGVVALLLQANPALTWRDVKYILAKTADMIDPTISQAQPPYGTAPSGYTYEQGWITNAAGFHFQNWYGFGRINVDNAVTMAKSYVSSLGTFKATGFKYASSAVQAIPDNSAAGISRSFNVTDSLALEAVQLRVSTDACASDVGLELTSPSGTKSIVMNINSRLRDGAILNHIFLSNAFYGEPSLGTWTVKAVDGKAGCTANLTNVQLNFFGH